MNHLINVINDIINTIKEKGPSVHNTLEIILYPYFKCRIYYEIAHKFYLKGNFLIARYLSEKAKRKT